MASAGRQLTGDGCLPRLLVGMEATLRAGADLLGLVCDQSNRSWVELCTHSSMCRATWPAKWSQFYWYRWKGLSTRTPY